MIEAGVEAMCVFDPGEDPYEWIVQAVYGAMAAMRACSSIHS